MDAYKAQLRSLRTLPRVFSRPASALRHMVGLYEASKSIGVALGGSGVRAGLQVLVDIALVCGSSRITRVSIRVCLYLCGLSTTGGDDFSKLVLSGIQGSSFMDSPGYVSARVTLVAAALGVLSARTAQDDLVLPIPLLRLLSKGVQQLREDSSRSGKRALLALRHSLSGIFGANIERVLEALCVPELDADSTIALEFLVGSAQWWKPRVDTSIKRVPALMPPSLCLLLTTTATRQLFEPLSTSIASVGSLSLLPTAGGMPSQSPVSRPSSLCSLFHSLSHHSNAEPCDLLLPLGLALRRRAETCLPWAGLLLGSLVFKAGGENRSLGSSDTVTEDWLGPLITAAGHATKDDARWHAISAVSALGRKFSMGGAGVHPPVLSAVVQCLTTKRGSFPQWQSRAGLYAALGAYGGGAWSGLAVGSHPSPSLSSLASEAVSFIAGSSGGITGEPHEGARKTGLAALSQWLPLLPRDDGGALIFPPGVLDFFVRGLVHRGEAGYFSALYFAGSGMVLAEDKHRDGCVAGASLPFSSDTGVRDVLGDAAPFSPACPALYLTLASPSGSPILAALFSCVAEHFCSYLPSSSGGKSTKTISLPSSPATIPSCPLYALGVLARVASLNPAFAEQLATPVFYGGFSSATATAKSSGDDLSAASGKSKGVKGVSGSGTNAAGGKSQAAAATPAAHPIFGAFSEGAARAADGGGKVYTFWDAFTSPALAPLLLTAPFVTGTQGRSSKDIHRGTCAALVATDTLFVGLRLQNFVKAFPKVYMGSVMGELECKSFGGEGVVLLGGEEGGSPPPPCSPLSTEIPYRQPSPLFSGLLSLLVHPSLTVRTRTAYLLHSLYTSFPLIAPPLAAALLHALWDLVRGYEVCMPRVTPSPSSYDTGTGQGWGVFSALGGVGVELPVPGQRSFLQPSSLKGSAGVKGGGATSGDTRVSKWRQGWEAWTNCVRVVEGGGGEGPLGGPSPSSTSVSATSPLDLSTFTHSTFLLSTCASFTPPIHSPHQLAFALSAILWQTLSAPFPPPLGWCGDAALTTLLPHALLLAAHPSISGHPLPPCGSRESGECGSILSHSGFAVSLPSSQWRGGAGEPTASGGKRGAVGRWESDGGGSSTTSSSSSKESTEVALLAAASTIRHPTIRGMGGDPKLRRAKALWKRCLNSLRTSVGGLAAGPPFLPAPPQAFSRAEARASSAVSIAPPPSLPLYPSNSDIILQSDAVGEAIGGLLIKSARSGLWAKGGRHTVRLGAIRAVSLLWGDGGPSVSRGSPKDKAWPGAFAGGRSIVTRFIFPAALSVLQAAAETRVSTGEHYLWSHSSPGALLAACSGVLKGGVAAASAAVGDPTFPAPLSPWAHIPWPASGASHGLDVSSSTKYEDEVPSHLYWEDVYPSRAVAISAAVRGAVQGVKSTRDDSLLGSKLLIDKDSQCAWVDELSRNLALETKKEVGALTKAQQSGGSGAVNSDLASPEACEAATSLLVHIDTLLSFAVPALNLISACAFFHNTGAIVPCLPYLVPAITPLLHCPLVGPHAHHALLSSLLPAGVMGTACAKKGGRLPHGASILWASTYRACSKSSAAPVFSFAPLFRAFLSSIAPTLLTKSSHTALAFAVLSGGDSQEEEGGDNSRNLHGTSGAVGNSSYLPSPLPIPVFASLLLPILSTLLSSSPPLPTLPTALSLVSLHTFLPPEVFNDASEELWGGRVSSFTVALSGSATARLLTGPSLSLGGPLSKDSALDTLSKGLEVAYPPVVFTACGLAPTTLVLSQHAALSPLHPHPDLALALHRSSSNELARGLLAALFTAPRASPSPSTLLLSLTRGMDPLGGGGVPISIPSEEEMESRLEEEEEEEEGVGGDAVLGIGGRLSTGIVPSLPLACMSSIIGDAGLLSNAAHVRAGALGVLSVFLASPIWKAMLSSESKTLEGLIGTEKAVHESTKARRALTTALLTRLWIVAHDEDGDNAALAGLLWSRFNCSLDWPESQTPPSPCSPALIEDISLPLPSTPASAMLLHVLHPSPSIAAASGKALASALVLYPQAIPCTLPHLFSTFRRYSSSALVNHPLAVALRVALISCIGACAEARVRTTDSAPLVDGDASRVIPLSLVPSTLRFLLLHGLPDSGQGVKEASSSAGASLVDAYGPAHGVDVIVPVLEAFLEADDATRKKAASNYASLDTVPVGLASKGAKASVSNTAVATKSSSGSAAPPPFPLAAQTEAGRDAQREGVIVWLGGCAKFFPAGSSRRDSALTILCDTLDTPSEEVQRAVARVLPPLLKEGERGVGEKHLSHLLSKLLSSPLPSLATQRGAAYGLGGVVAGLGLPCLYKAGVLTSLESASGESPGKGPTAVVLAKEARYLGALYGFEMLCNSLGPLFEPYLPRLLPAILKAYGETLPSIRTAALATGAAFMRILTGHGVRVVLPVLLNSVSQGAHWKTKAAALSLLGSMAHCAPSQLSSLLPTVVPWLSKSLDDPHPNVQEAGKASLTSLTASIRNPALQACAPTLLAALGDPSGGTLAALHSLKKCNLDSTIDPPSLALLVPILRRGLCEARSTELRTTAGVIVGNLAKVLPRPEDLMPYLEGLMGPLQSGVCDPIPEVRAVAGRTLGALVCALGQSRLPRVLPWLKSLTTKEAGGVECSGGAGAYVAVLVALGEPVLSEEISWCIEEWGDPKNLSSGAREGFMWVCMYLPPLLGPVGFVGHLPVLFPKALSGMGDDVESVRDVAGRAARVMVRSHARCDPSLLFPGLENGCTSSYWRIRLASVNLVSSLLADVAGMELPEATEDMNEEEEEGGEEEGRGDDASPIDAGIANTKVWASSKDAEGGKGGGKGGGRKAPTVGDAVTEFNQSTQPTSTSFKDGKGKGGGGSTTTGSVAAAAAAFLEGGLPPPSSSAASKEGSPKPVKTNKGSWRDAAPTLGHGGRPPSPPGGIERKRKKGERGHAEDSIPLSARRGGAGGSTARPKASLLKANASKSPAQRHAAQVQALALRKAALKSSEEEEEEEEEEFAASEDGENSGDEDDDEEGESGDEGDSNGGLMDEENETDEEEETSGEDESVEFDEDEGSESESEAEGSSALDKATRAHIRVLGEAPRGRILSALYLARSDSVQSVRQAALNAWKNNVTNTPRTLKSILPALVSLILTGLSSGDDGVAGEERRESCGKCLGDIVKKMGERVLPTVLPMLASALRSNAGPGKAAALVRGGVCAGLCELLEGVSRGAVVAHTRLLLEVIQEALCDEDESVGEGAKRAFAALQRILGGGGAALDSMLPTLLQGLERAMHDEEGGSHSYHHGLFSAGRSAVVRALSGLAAVASVRPRAVLPSLLPLLLQNPIAPHRALALTAVAQATGPTLHYYWSNISQALCKEIVGEAGGKKSRLSSLAQGEKLASSLKLPPSHALSVFTAHALGGFLGHTLAACARSVSEGGVSWVVEDTCKLFASPNGNMRCVAAWIMTSLAVAAPWGGSDPPVYTSSSSSSSPSLSTSSLLLKVESVSGGSEGEVMVVPPPPPQCGAPRPSTSSSSSTHASSLTCQPLSGPPLEGQTPFILKECLARGEDTDACARKAAWDAVGAIVGGVTGSISEEASGTASAILAFVRSCLSGMISDVRFRKGGIGGVASYTLPSLSHPKGLDALLPLYLRVLLGGTADARAEAAEGLGELVDIASFDGLKAYFIKITGPLIRVFADKFPFNLKVAILGTLRKLIVRGGATLKPFLPQLQASFIKALSDPTLGVREGGADALATLAPLVSRADPLLSDLAGLLDSNAQGGSEASVCGAIRGVLIHLPPSAVVSDSVRCRLLVAVRGLMGDDDPFLRKRAAGAFGALLKGGEPVTVAGALASVIFLTQDPLLKAGCSHLSAFNAAAPSPSLKLRVSRGEEVEGVTGLDSSGGDAQVGKDVKGATRLPPWAEGRVLAVNAALRYSWGTLSSMGLTNLLVAHLALCSEGGSGELREAGAVGWGYAAKGFSRSGDSSTLKLSSSSLTSLLGDPALHVRIAAAGGIGEGVLGEPPMPLASLLTLARDTITPLYTCVTKDTPNSILRHKANVALGSLLGWNEGGKGPCDTPRGDVLALCGKEGAKFLEGYYSKVLKKELEEAAGGEDEEDPFK